MKPFYLLTICATIWIQSTLNLNLDFANKADERLSCKYEGDDIEIGFNSRFIIDMLNNIGSDNISLEMSEPNRAGILLPLDGQEESEETLMLVMPVMLNS